MTKTNRRVRARIHLSRKGRKKSATRFGAFRGRHTDKCWKLGQKIFRKLCGVDDSIEIIAREIARQSKRKP